MKSIAYILVDDLLHPSERIVPFLSNFFDYSKWHVCVLTHLSHICEMTSAPDLIVNFKDSRDNWRFHTPSFYDESFSYQIADFVTKEGCGYIAVHAGLIDIPADHPLKTKVLFGGVDYPSGKPEFLCNKFFGKIPGLPFGLFSDITFSPAADHPVLEGIDTFTVKDEQYEVTIPDETAVDILGYSESKEAGRSIAAWAHNAGKGRAVGIAMGHLTETLSDPSVQKLIKNAINWCSKETNQSN